jgi:hypothetical protein
MSDEQGSSQADTGERVRKEEFEVSGEAVISKIKELIHEGMCGGSRLKR